MASKAIVYKVMVYIVAGLIVTMSYQIIGCGESSTLGEPGDEQKNNSGGDPVSEHPLFDAWDGRANVVLYTNEPGGGGIGPAIRDAITSYVGLFSHYKERT